jgi:hypothetical protein
MLVEIDRLTEAQVRAFVKGPLTQHTGVPCRCRMEIHNGQCVAYIFVGEEDEVGCSGYGRPGDQSQEARDAAAMLAACEVIEDTDFPAVWAVYIS